MKTWLLILIHYCKFWTYRVQGALSFSGVPRGPICDVISGFSVTILLIMQSQTGVVQDVKFQWCGSVWIIIWIRIQYPEILHSDQNLDPRKTFDFLYSLQIKYITFAHKNMSQTNYQRYSLRKIPKFMVLSGMFLLKLCWWSKFGENSLFLNLNFINSWKS